MNSFNVSGGREVTLTIMYQLIIKQIQKYIITECVYMVYFSTFCSMPLGWFRNN